VDVMKPDTFQHPAPFSPVVSSLVLWDKVLAGICKFFDGGGWGSTEYMDVDRRLRARKFYLRRQKQLAELGILYSTESCRTSMKTHFMKTHSLIHL
jgi:hypothetical protein